MKLYLRLLAAGLRAKLQYKFDFLMTSILYGLITGLEFLTVAAILYRFSTVAGWNVYEIALLSGMASASNGLYRVLGSELTLFERYLVSGEFDNLLIRPWPTLASLLTRNFDIGRIGAYAQGMLLILVGLHGVGAAPWLWVYCLVVPFAGALVVGSIYLAVATAGFWITRIDDLQTFAANAPLTAVNYPQEIFPKALRWLFLSLLPMAAIGYVPLTYALGKGGAALGLIVPFLAAGVSVAVTLRLWGWGERHYQSTGS